MIKGNFIMIANIDSKVSEDQNINEFNQQIMVVKNSFMKYTENLSQCFVLKVNNGKFLSIRNEVLDDSIIYFDFISPLLIKTLYSVKDFFDYFAFDFGEFMGNISEILVEGNQLKTQMYKVQKIHQVVSASIKSKKLFISELVIESEILTKNAVIILEEAAKEKLVLDRKTLGEFYLESTRDISPLFKPFTIMIDLFVNVGVQKTVQARIEKETEIEFKKNEEAMARSLTGAVILLEQSVTLYTNAIREIETIYNSIYNDVDQNTDKVQKVKNNTEALTALKFKRMQYSAAKTSQLSSLLGGFIKTLVSDFQAIRKFKEMGGEALTLTPSSIQELKKIKCSSQTSLMYGLQQMENECFQ